MVAFLNNWHYPIYITDLLDVSYPEGGIMPVFTFDLIIITPWVEAHYHPQLMDGQVNLSKVWFSQKLTDKK